MACLDPRSAEMSSHDAIWRDPQTFEQSENSAVNWSAARTMPESVPKEAPKKVKEFPVPFCPRRHRSFSIAFVRPLRTEGLLCAGNMRVRQRESVTASTALGGDRSTDSVELPGRPYAPLNSKLGGY